MAATPSQKIARILMIFIIGVFFIKHLNGTGFFEPTSYKGRGYTVKIPEGWKKIKKEKGTRSSPGIHVVYFVPKETVLEGGAPDIFISIQSKKLVEPIWIEDEFPGMITALKRSGMDVKDHGKIEFNKMLSGWVVYHNKRIPALILEFYVVNENNMFYTMRYSSKPNQFNQSRHAFEELKDSFKFRFGV